MGELARPGCFRSDFGTKTKFIKFPKKNDTKQWEGVCVGLAWEAAWPQPCSHGQ